MPLKLDPINQLFFLYTLHFSRLKGGADKQINKQKKYKKVIIVYRDSNRFIERLFYIRCPGKTSLWR